MSDRDLMAAHKARLLAKRQLSAPPAQPSGRLFSSPQKAVDFLTSRHFQRASSTIWKKVRNKKLYTVEVIPSSDGRVRLIGNLS